MQSNLRLEAAAIRSAPLEIWGLCNKRFPPWHFAHTGGNDCGCRCVDQSLALHQVCRSAELCLLARGFLNGKRRQLSLQIL